MNRFLVTMIAWAVFSGAITARHSALGFEPPVVVVQADRTTELAPHRKGNVYAPEVHRHGGKLWMWYGGQGADGHDRIHLADSEDGKRWNKHGVVIDNGSANHVNDPSVVRVGNMWWMFYTIAQQGEQDQIAAATSSDGRQWKLLGVVLDVGRGNVWNSGKVGRPSVLFEDNQFHLWYDGQPSQEAVESGDELSRSVRAEGRAVGYANSMDGLVWERAKLPVFRNGAGAVHVAKYPRGHVLLYESGRGTHWASAESFNAWRDRGMLLEVSGQAIDAYGHVTPFLLIDGDTTNLYFGAAARQTWDGNSIAVLPVTLP